MKNTVAKIILSLIIAIAPQASIADSPASESTIRELLKVTNAEQLMMQKINNLVPLLANLQPDIPMHVWEKYLSEVQVSELVDITVQIYQRNFTEEEIQAALQFLKSPLGRSYVAKQPKVLEESMAAGMLWGESVARRALEKAGRYEENSP